VALCTAPTRRYLINDEEHTNDLHHERHHQ